MSGVCWVYWKGRESWSGKMGEIVVEAAVGLNPACRLGFFCLTGFGDAVSVGM